MRIQFIVSRTSQIIGEVRDGIYFNIRNFYMLRSHIYIYMISSRPAMRPIKHVPPMQVSVRPGNTTAGKRCQYYVPYRSLTLHTHTHTPTHLHTHTHTHTHLHTYTPTHLHTYTHTHTHTQTHTHAQQSWKSHFTAHQFSGGNPV